MSRKVILPRVFHNAIGHGDPIHAMDDGNSVVTQTVDAWGVKLDRRTDRDTAQSANGSIFRQWRRTRRCG